MRSNGFIFGLILLVLSENISGNNFREYFDPRFTLRYVEMIPPFIENQVLVISNRYFEPSKNYLLKRGLDPKYRMFFFIAGLSGDTCYIKPMGSLDESIGTMPVRSDFLIYVDGHGKTFDQVLERGFEMTERFNINMVLFDWPSDYLALRKTVRNADEVSGNFVMAMNLLDNFHRKYFAASAVSVIFHSMGNRILKDVAESRVLLKQMPQGLFSNIIINAAAVRQRQHANWVEDLNIEKEIYITLNSVDRTLQGAALLRATNQLGLGGKGRLARNAIYVSFNSLSTIDHNLFLGKSQTEKDNKNIFVFYKEVFHGKKIEIPSNPNHVLDLQSL